jgi:hypothetical protein
MSGLNDTEKLGRLLGAVKTYIDAPGQLKGEAFTEMAATAALIDGKEYIGHHWPYVVEKMTNAVKTYLEATGDDLCHLNRQELAAAFGLGPPPSPHVLDPIVMMGNCVNYINCLNKGRDYINPNTGRVHKHPMNGEYDAEEGLRDRVKAILYDHPNVKFSVSGGKLDKMDAPTLLLLISDLEDAIRPVYCVVHCCAGLMRDEVKMFLGDKGGEVEIEEEDADCFEISIPLCDVEELRKMDGVQSVNIVQNPSKSRIA